MQDFIMRLVKGICLCCLDSVKMMMGACLILQKICIFGGSDTGVASTLESPNIGISWSRLFILPFVLQ